VYGAGLASKARILVGVCGAALLLLDLCEPPVGDVALVLGGALTAGG